MGLPDLLATPWQRMAFYDSFPEAVRCAIREAPYPPSDLVVKLWLDRRDLTEADVIARIRAYRPEGS